MDKLPATFCIATYADIPTTIDTINSLLPTVEGYDIKIIVVDDANTIKHELDMFPMVSVYRNEKRIGVGYSLDRAVRLAETEICFIMGNDIRFNGNEWYPRLYETTINNPKSIICTATLGLNENRLQITGKESRYLGSHILYEVTEANNNRVLPFRRYIESKWNTPDFIDFNGDVEQTGSVLGAFYAINRSFFLKVSSWGLHRVWGSLEPWVSMSYAINGGNCLIDMKAATGHIFRSASSHKPIRDLIYNKLAVAYMYLPTDMEQEVFAWCKTLQHSELSFVFFEQNRKELDKFRQLKLELGDEKVRELLKPTGVLD